MVDIPSPDRAPAEEEDSLIIGSSRSFAHKSAAGDPLIHAYALDAMTGKKICVSFPRSRVDMLVVLGESETCVMLRNGTAVPLALPRDEVENKIFLRLDACAAVVDLQPHFLSDQKPPSLKREFQQAITDTPVRIYVFARQSKALNFQQFSFLDTEVDWAGVEHIEEGFNGPATLFPLKNGKKDPFGGDKVIIDIGRRDFMVPYNLAKMNNQSELDLRNETRRQPAGPDKPAKPPAPKSPK